MNRYKADFKKSVIPKQAHSMAVAPEEARLDYLYAFSFNPAIQPVLHELKGLEDWLNHFAKLFYECYNCEIQVVPELSKGGRFHFHGYIMYKNIIKAYAIDLRKLSEGGTYEIDTIADSQAWRIYVYKQFGLMKPFIDKETECPYQIDTEKLRIERSKLKLDFQ